MHAAVILETTRCGEDFKGGASRRGRQVINLQMIDPEFTSKFNWNDVKLFLQLAQTGTLTAAAAALGLSQPTASRRLRALEIVAGSPLFQRDGLRYVLTDQGEVMLTHAKRMEEETFALALRLNGADHAIEGLVKVTSNDWFCHRVLARPVSQFVLANPSISVELIADPRFVDLRRRQADMAIRFTPFGDASVVQRRIAEVRYGLYASDGYVDQRGSPDATDEGEGHQLILLDSALDAGADVAWLKKRLPKARIAFRSNNRESQAEACSNGVGVAVLPRMIGDALPLQLIDGDEPPGRVVYLGYHSDLRSLRRLRALIDFLASNLPRQI